MAQTLNNVADRLTIGDPLVSGRLTIYPLFSSGGKKVDEENAPDQKEIRYLLLEEALDKGTFKKPRPEPEELKEAIEKSEYLTYPSVSMGQDLRLSGPGITGAGLIVEEERIHLSIFPATDNEKQSRSNIRTPRQRRRGMGSDDIVC